MNVAAIVIAILSLFISGISLFFSFQKDRLEKRLAAAQKKSDLLRYITDSKYKLERRLSKIQRMNEIWDTCDSCPTESLKYIEESVRRSIAKYDAIFERLDNADNDIDPILLENLIPHFYSVAQQAEDGFLETLELIEGCMACQEEKRRGTSNKPPS